MSIKKLLLKSITGRPLRSLALLFICAIMSGAVYGGAVVWASIDNGISSLEKRLGADIIVVPKSAGEKTKLEEMLLQGTVGYFYMDKSVSDELDKIDGVEKQSSQFFLVSANSECCSAKVQIIGFDEDTDISVKPWLQNAYSKRLGQNEIIVGSKLTTKVGQIFKLYGVECKAVGKLESTGTGVDTAVYASSDTVKGLIRAAQSKGISVLSKQSPDDVISSVYIKVRDGYDIDEVAAKINLGIDGVQAVRTRSMITGTADKLSVLSAGITILIAAVCILSAVIMLVVFTALANERKGEFALLRVIGFSRARLARQVLGEAFVICVIGALAGIAAASAAVFPFGALIEKKADLPMLSPGSLSVIGYALIAFAAVCVTGPLASAYSAYRLSRIDTGRILREGDS